ncbi:MAG: polysaccharide biosynthesis/export family protein [Verrucomicrobiota bacterium]
MNFFSRLPIHFAWLPAIFLLPSCGLISDTGPLKREIVDRDEPRDYELVEVKSRTDLPRSGRVYGMGQKPGSVKGQGYSDKIRSRDSLIFTITDLTEQSPFRAGGPKNDYGPYEVPADGRVSIPYVGEVQVIGQTPADVAAGLAERIKPISNTARISVSRTGRVANTANVLGTVRTPGPVALEKEGFNSLDLLASAGGPTQPEHLALYTLKRGGREYHFDYLGFRKRPFIVEEGDFLSVTTDTSNRFHIMGALNRPTTIAFPSPSPTLADALGSGSGLDERRSDPSGVFVFRKGSPNMVYTFNMKDPSVMPLIQRFPMKGEDIVYITEAPLTRWNRLLSQILPSVIPQTVNNAHRLSN